VGRCSSKSSYELFIPNKSSKICGIHFNMSGKKTCDDKLPKYLLPSCYSNDDDKVFFQTYDINRLKIKSNQSLPPNPATYDETEIAANVSNIQKVPKSLTIVKQQSIDIKSKSNTKEKIVKKKTNALVCKLKNMSISNKKCAKEITRKDKIIIKLKKQHSVLEDTIKLLQSKLDNLNVVYNESKFRVENIKKSPSQLHFYTGFTGIERYEAFETLVKECYDNSNDKPENIGRPRKLNFSNELFLYFCRIRCGHLEEDLAYRFNVSTSSVSRIFSYWSAFLCDMLSKVPIWIDRRTIDETMPAEVKAKYPTTRLIIDATEIFVELPSEFNTQSDIYSQYKHHSTAKGVTGCDTLGRVTFVSDLVPGKMSDKQLTIESGLLELLEEGDSVMCDRGFLLEEEFKEIGVELNMPSFLNGRNQLPLAEEHESRQIATFRINIERVFRDVKTFRILKQVFPNTMFDKLNEIWKVCCFLVNFIDEPLLER
jgi:hypothetical protein